jgi:hypothetical protein
MFEELMGLSHVAAPPGMVVEVVVWFPFTHTHSTVSPTTALKLAGVNEKSATFTTCFTGTIVGVAVKLILLPTHTGELLETIGADGV